METAKNFAFPKPDQPFLINENRMADHEPLKYEIKNSGLVKE